ncbi:unnamed protein product, partial [Nesidiocoris tenuis]
MNTVQESKSWMIQRRQLLDGYDSIHSLTLTKSFYGDFPDSKLWNDRKLWFHLLCTLFSELTFMMFEVYNFITKETFFEALLSLTICLISILVLTRTYVFYTGLRTIRRLYFKPEVFHSNKHRPVSSLTRLKEGDQLRAALYESNWDSDLKRCSEDIVVPLMLCGKKIQLTAFGMIPIQIQTFIE